MPKRPPSSRARTLAAIKSLFSFGQRVGYLSFNVGAAVKLPARKDTLSERILTEADVQKMLVLESDGRNHALLRLLYAGGLRVNELAELTPSEQSKPASAPKATGACRVLTASYGGKKTLLVRTKAGTETHYTALTVLEGFEGSMLENFVRAHGPGGASIGEYETKDAALAKAKELCPGSAAAPKVEGASAG